MASTRQRRVGELLKEEIGKIIQRDVSDPRVGFATVTEVDVTADLREARVYVSVLQDAQRKESLAALQRAAKFIRGLLARRVDLRVAPELTFYLDTSMERGSRVLELFHEIEKEKEERADAP